MDSWKTQFSCWGSDRALNIVPYIPSVIFFSSYFFMFQQFAVILFPSRLGHNPVFVCVLSLLLFSEVSGVWLYVVNGVKILVDIYVVGQPYTLGFFNVVIPTVNGDYIKFFSLSLLSLFPAALSFFIVQKQRVLRFNWIDMRQRNRTELGSGRYYLSRPCILLESEQQQRRARRVFSDQNLARASTLKRPKTA